MTNHDQQTDQQIGIGSYVYYFFSGLSAKSILSLSLLHLKLMVQQNEPTSFHILHCLYLMWQQLLYL